jgi:hypothetical protein
MEEVPNYTTFEELPEDDPDDDDSSDNDDDEDDDNDNDNDNDSDSDNSSSDDDESDSDSDTFSKNVNSNAYTSAKNASDKSDLSLSERVALNQEKGKTRKYKDRRAETGKEKMKRALEEGKHTRGRDGKDEGARKKKVSRGFEQARSADTLGGHARQTRSAVTLGTSPPPPP